MPYRAVLISADGKDYVTDFHDSESIDSVWDSINDMGSRWFFYPFAFVIKDSGHNVKSCRIKDVPDLMPNFLINRTVRTAMDFIAVNQWLGKP